MATRYKKIQWNDIRSGIGQNYFKPETKKIYSSRGIDIDFETGRAKLAQALETKTHANNYSGGTIRKLICQHAITSTPSTQHTYYLLKNLTGPIIELWSGLAIASYALKKAFNATYTDPYYLCEVQGKLFAQMKNNGNTVVMYSSDHGLTFTDINWDYGIIRNHTIDEDNKLWLVTESGYIISTEDLIEYKIEFESTIQNYSNIEYLDGFIYLIITDNYFTNAVFARIENSKIKIIYKFKNNNDRPDFITQDDTRIIIATNVRTNHFQILEWNKGEIKEIGLFYFPVGGLQGIQFLCGNRYAVYLSLGNTIILKINKDNGFFYLYQTAELSPFYYCLAAVLDDDTVYDSNLVMYLSAGLTTATQIANQSNILTLTTGLYITPTVDEGEHAPAYLILKCNPQLATTTITIKAKKNKESTFSTTIMTAHTTGMTRKVIDLKTLLATKLDYIQFEITVADTAGAITGPAELDLIYLFTPTGLENSQ